MQQVLIMGAGKIGTLIAFLLSESGDYQVYLADVAINRSELTRLAEKTQHLHLVQLDANDQQQVTQFLKNTRLDALISSLPFYCNVPIAHLAKEFHLNYFDLTEDTHTTATISQISQDAKTAFLPQCGLAPGFISIVANDLMRRFSSLDTVKMRVGALPVNTSNALQYSLTWSTDGLINEYGNLCQAIENGKEVTLLPLDGLEEIEIDGLIYEAFNTSGGIGSLANTYLNKVKYLNYKTIRYPGHCAKMHFLMNDLQLNQDRDTLKIILENALPKTTQDVVIVYVSVTGRQDNQFIEDNYVKKFYPLTIKELPWSAIQLTTASSLCAIVDLVLSQPQKYQGLIAQENFSLAELTSNRFGAYFAKGKSP